MHDSYCTSTAPFLVSYIDLDGPLTFTNFLHHEDLRGTKQNKAHVMVLVCTDTRCTRLGRGLSCTCYQLYHALDSTNKQNHDKKAILFCQTCRGTGELPNYLHLKWQNITALIEAQINSTPIGVSRKGKRGEAD